MNATTIAVLLLLVAVFSGYLAAKWANNWSYWSHRWCGAAVIGLAWMALPKSIPAVTPQLETITHEQRVAEKKRELFASIQQRYDKILKERANEQDESR